MKFEQIRNDIQNLQIIGKGWRGIVYRGNYKGLDLAFKVPREEKYVKSIQKEAQILKELNKYGIGGKLEIIGEDFIGYRFIEGKPLIKIINKNNAKDLLYQLFKIARKMDKIGISKDEMHRPYKNVIVDSTGKVHLIDFEKAVFSKKPHNITQLLHFVITSGKKFFDDIDKDTVIKLAKEYRKKPDEENFQKILGYLFKQHQL